MEKMNREEFLDKYTRHLNSKQLRAVQSVNGPVLLLAVPGSGKTTVLVTRLGYMLLCEQIPASNILTLTYTIAATADMSKRFTAIFGEQYNNTPEFRTINGICAKIIQQYGQRIGKEPFELITDEKLTARILTDILVHSMSEYPTESDVKTAKTLITYCKNMMLTQDEIERLGEQEGIPLRKIYDTYNDYLKKNHFMDYDDQMIYAYRMLRGSAELLEFYREKYQYICVDEAQDTSKIQHAIIGLLAGKNGNLFMVGDEDQSIYGFRAAYPEALLHFEEDHPEATVLVMDQNYRSNAKIVAAADMFIQHNKARHEKHMVATREADTDIHYIELRSRSNQYSYLAKVAKDCNRETAVLYRDNESVLPLIDQLDRQGIPYGMKNIDMGFFTHRIVTDVTNIMRFALDPYNGELFLKIYFKCQTYLKKKQAEELCEISTQRHIPILEAAEYSDNISSMVLGKCRAFGTHLRSMLKEAPDKVIFRIETPLGYGEYLERNNMDDNKLFILKQLAYQEVSMARFLFRLEELQAILKNPKKDEKSPFMLSTIHSSKGLEYDRVYLLDVCDGVFPNQVIRSNGSATPQERKEFEEERRLFYVGMTRAKNELYLFRLGDSGSHFLKEMNPVSEKKKPTKKTGRAIVEKPYSAFANPKPANVLPADFELAIGERIIQKMYGAGTVSDVDYNAQGKAYRFEVTFDSGLEKLFMFPIAFKTGMRLEER